MVIYKTLFKLLLVLGIGGYALSVQALALSDAELKSHLNQLLDVRIQLITDDVSELDDLRITLSHLAENNVTHYQLKYEVLKGKAGNILKITSRDVIREPIIEFSLDIGWSDGHVVREYSFLIDPPRN